MPQFAANLSMLYPEHDFLDRFAKPPRPTASKGVEYLFPYAYPARQSWPRGLQANGLAAGAVQRPARRL
jgi:hydroxypyruvate isomerase